MLSPIPKSPQSKDQTGHSILFSVVVVVANAVVVAIVVVVAIFSLVVASLVVKSSFVSSMSLLVCSNSRLNQFEFNSSFSDSDSENDAHPVKPLGS